MFDLVKKVEHALGDKLDHPVRIPLSMYYPISATGVLCTATGAAGAAVIGMTQLKKKKEITHLGLCAAVSAVCSIAMTVGGSLLYAHGESFAEPIKEVTKAAEDVSKGDYSVRLTEPQNNFRISELADLTASFNKMAAQLDASDYMKKDFISNVSHEFKTPLAAISGFCELLEDPAVTEEERTEYLSVIRQETEHLSHLCENMLRMSRLDNMKILTRHEDIRLDEQMRRAVIMLAESHPERAEDFSVDVEELHVESDPDLTEQIFVALLDNAVKYSEPGTEISLSGTEKGGQIILSIADNGIGIPEDQKEHVFERFYQCDTSHKNEGNGLGLSIVRRIAELLGGTIQCADNLPSGTIFTVKIPKKS